MTSLPEYALSTTNGCVPDFNGPLVQSWPSASGEIDKEDTKSIAAKATADCIRLPEVVLYEHINFGGASAQTSLNWYYVGDYWNDRTSSIVVLGGRWRFYEHWHYQGRYWDLPPGQYRWVQDNGIPNDMISSFQLISFC